MLRSFDELFAETARVRQNMDLVRIVYGTSSPTEAENRAKEREYPTDLVRGTRILAVMKRDHEDNFKRAIGFLDREYDPWRYFDCTYDSHYPIQYDEVGILAVKPDFLLPPLFWTYALYNSDGEKLFSFEDRSLGETTYYVVLESGSRSLPAGLKMSTDTFYDSVSFEYACYSQKSIWIVEGIKRWPAEAYYWKNRGFNENACLRHAFPGGPVAGVPQQYKLIICDKLERNTGSPDKAEQNSTFIIVGKYRFFSPWHEIELFSKKAGILSSDPKEHAPLGLMDVKSPLSIEFHTTSYGMRVPEESQTRSLEDVVKSMLLGLPKKINSVETLKQLFSFKSPHISCYNKNNMLPLVPYPFPTS